jgi:predicted metal-binding membrane protein
MAAALQRAGWRHPEAGAAAVAALAWVLLLAPAAGGEAMRALHDDAHAAAPFAAGAAGWLLMAAAMMLPGALPAARALAVTALWARRGRTVALFLGAYVAVWAAFGAAAYAVLAVAGPPPELMLPALLALAAAWQLTGVKWRAVRSCHLLPTLPPRGRRADRACAVAGLRYGRSCLASCWLLMAAMVVAGHASAGLTALLAAIVTAEKLAARPSRLAAPTAALVAGAALVSIPI